VLARGQWNDGGDLKRTEAWRLNAERIVLFGWTRAILLQLAHPLIAAAVSQHGSFRRGRLQPVLRLRHTVRAMQSLTFGSEARRTETIKRINALHRTINGTLDEEIGPFRRGTRYSAEDPALLLWVHATLVESVPLAYERFVGPMTDAERDRYCDEAAWMVEALGGTDRPIPRTAAAVRQYIDEMYASGHIVVSATARELARGVLQPPFAWTAWPATRVNWLFAVGLLPAHLQAQYGFTWTTRDEQALRRWTRVLSALRRLIPDALATWRQSRSHQSMPSA